MVSFRTFLESQKDALDQLHQQVPNFPPYVLQDMLLNQRAFGTDVVKAYEFLKEFAGWHGYQRVEDMIWKQEKIHLDAGLKMFEPQSREMMELWLGGAAHGANKEEDAARHQWQMTNMQTPCAGSDEPVIVARQSKGLFFIEGKHRIITGIKKCPQGFEQIAWVLQSKV